MTTRIALSASGNLLLATLFGLFAYAHLQNFLEVARASVLLIIVKELIDACFYLIRRRPVDFSLSPYAWTTALAGTGCSLLLRPSDVSHDLLLGQVIQWSGLVLQILGMLSLNRSIGMVPANRGIKTTGLYRWVRHPLYSSYAITQIGYLINNPNLHNAAVVTLSICFQILRLYNEERFLREDPAYEQFMKSTRWRLFPYIL